MPRAITKKEAIEAEHYHNRGYQFKVIDWIKLPVNARILIYQVIYDDSVYKGKETVETRAHIHPAKGEGGGAGVILGSRSRKKK